MKFKYFKYCVEAPNASVTRAATEPVTLCEVGFIGYDTEDEAWEAIYKYEDENRRYLVLRKPFYY